MELLDKLFMFFYDSLQAVSEEKTQILKMVLVGLTTMLVTITTLSYDRLGGPNLGYTTWQPAFLAVTLGTLAAAYTATLQ